VPAPAPLSLDELARRLARYAWLEHRLFQLLGQWTPSTPELEAKLLFGAQSRHHAWRADLFIERLPERHGLTGASLLADAATPDLDALLDRVASTGQGDGTVLRLVAVHRVLLPAAIAAHTEHLRRTTIVADLPTARALRMALADETTDQQAGEQLLQALLADASKADRAAQRQRALEADLEAAGGLIPGPQAAEG
jgi:hypothetical protein